MDTKAISGDIVEQLKRAKKPAEPAFFQMRRGGRNLTIDAEGYWSYPALIPAGEGAVLWLSLVLATVAMPEKKHTALFRPKCMVLTKPESCLLVRYDHFRLSHDPFPTVAWDKPLAMFPHQSVAGLTYEQLEQKETILLALYPAAASAFVKSGQLPDDFRTAYLELIHPAFLPFLNPLAPKFVAALKVAEFAQS
ncbi:MAG TPA: hypothetical protein VK961_24895 [Chthoniobacter sp.]|nr:hypothetical protein [Chthoniobacter sp.]